MGNVKYFLSPSDACRMARASEETWGPGAWSPPSHKTIIVEIQQLTLSSLTQCSLHSVASCVCACCYVMEKKLLSEKYMQNEQEEQPEK